MIRTLTQPIIKLVGAGLLLAAVGCGAPATVLFRFNGTPDDALVTINDRYIGKLGRLKKKGIKLPEGEYRITVEHNGYFPHDQIVQVQEDVPPPPFAVELTPVPD